MARKVHVASWRTPGRWIVIFSGIIALSMVSIAGSARAESVRILALGASNTNGKGVGASAAWPAQLERMLRARGYDATVSVNAINGDTSAGVLARTADIPPGTRVVIFDTGGDNDRKRGRTEAEINATKIKIIKAIRSNGAKPIVAPYRKVVGPMRSRGTGYQPDGHHLTARSHAKIAAYLLPTVVAAIKQDPR